MTRQGDDRVLVQIPGGQIDRSRARRAAEGDGLPRVQDRARLGFETEELLRARYDDGHARGHWRSGVRAGRRDRASCSQARICSTPKVADITGDYLTDARLSTSTASKRPIVLSSVSITAGRPDLRRADRRQHRIELPRDRAGRQRVYSAPVIRGRIGSRGQIEGPLHRPGRSGGSRRRAARGLAADSRSRSKRSVQSGRRSAQDSIEPRRCKRLVDLGYWS